MNKNQHYPLTRIFIPTLVTLFLTGLLTSGASVFGAAPAQGGRILGRVVADIPDQREALSGVVVTLSSDRPGDKKIQSVSDMEGQYDFPGLIAGEYILTVEFSGFKKYEKKLSVQIEATVEQNILLQPVLLNCRIDLDAQFLLIFLETRKLNRYYVLARNQTRKVVLTFHVADALNFLVSQSVTAQSDDHPRQSFALVGNIGNNFAQDSASLRRGRTKNGRRSDQKKCDQNGDQNTR